MRSGTAAAVFLCSLSAAACKGSPSAKATGADAEKILVEAQSAASAKNAAWRTAIDGAKTSAVPRADLGKCPVNVGFPPSLTLLGVEAFLREAGVDTNPPSNVAVYLAKDVATATSPRMRQFDSKLSSFARGAADSPR